VPPEIDANLRSGGPTGPTPSQPPGRSGVRQVTADNGRELRRAPSRAHPHRHRQGSRAASGLNGANVNVLNGADGLGEIAAGLVGQDLTILDSVRQNLGAPAAKRASAERNGDGAIELR
jgi:hypothetical protein